MAAPASRKSRLSVDPPPGAAEPGPPVDLVHLGRQTLGEAHLEAELLGLFLRQARQIGTGLQAAPKGEARVAAADVLHMLVGSARVIGAARVVAAAEASEQRLRAGGTLGEPGLRALRSAIAEACDFIEPLIGPA